MSDFGVTKSDIEALVHGLVLSAGSSPTQAQVEDWIFNRTQIIAGYIRASGGDPDALATDSEGYSFAQEAIRSCVSAVVHIARGSLEHYKEWQARCDASMSMLKDSLPVVLGSDAPRDVGVPYFTTALPPDLLPRGF